MLLAFFSKKRVRAVAQLVAAVSVAIPTGAAFRLAGTQFARIPLTSLIEGTVVPGAVPFPPGTTDAGVVLTTQEVFAQVLPAPYAPSSSIESTCLQSGCPGLERQWTEPSSGDTITMAVVYFPTSALARSVISTTHPRGFTPSRVPGIPGAVSGTVQGVVPVTALTYSVRRYFVLTTIGHGACASVEPGCSPRWTPFALAELAAQNEYHYLAALEQHAQQVASRAANQARPASSSTAGIVGGIAGGVLLVLLITGFVIYRRRRPRPAKPLVIEGLAPPGGDAESPSGWYADPSPGSGSQLRWWDGHEWGLGVLDPGATAGPGPGQESHTGQDEGGDVRVDADPEAENAGPEGEPQSGGDLSGP